MRIGSSDWAMHRSGFYPGFGGLGYVGPGPYRRRRRPGMGDLKSDLVNVAKGGVAQVTGQAEEISKKMDQVKTLLIVSTTAASIAALAALFRR